MKNILIIWPLGNPFYFSDFWRSMLVYELASHIRKYDINVDIFDGTKNKIFSELFEKILNKSYDAFILNAPLDSLDGFIKTLKYIRLLDIKKPIYVYGLSTILKPNFFKNLDIQGFSNSGFFEKGILSFLGKKDPKVNCIIKDNNDNWIEYPRELGLPKDWSFMDLNDALKFSVLRISVSRGCHGACNFCSCAILHGNHDIRKTATEVCNYLELLEKKSYTGIIEFASPTFTISKEWINDFYNEYKNKRLKIKWRCVTRVDQIDEDIISKMSEINCIRIGLGIETLSEVEQSNINKKISKERVFNVINLIQKYNIEVLSYLISGIENQTSENFLYTYNILKKLNTTPRVTALLRYFSLNFENLIDTSIASDMCTSSLNKFLDVNNYYLLKIITGTADLDEK